MTFCTGPILWPGCPRTELSAAKRGLWTDSAPMTRQFGIASAYVCACPSHRRHAAGLMVSMPRLAVASADTTMLRRRRPANVRPILFETALDFSPRTGQDQFTAFHDPLQIVLGGKPAECVSASAGSL